MSVVNRMLLDIDRRHGAAEVQSRGPYPDIRSVAPGAKPRGRSSMGIVALIAAAVAIATALYFAGAFHRSEAPPAKSTAPVAVRGAPPAALAVPPAAPAVPAAAPALQSPVAEPEPRAVVMSAPPAPEREPAAVPLKPRKAPAAIESFKLSRQLSPVEERPLPPAAPAAQPALRGASAVSSPAVKSALPLRAGAADETVAAARVLWNEGSRAGALASLRDALAAAEGARNPAAVTPIARELARLEVADNRPQVALDLLRRFEGALADDAEAWALRGNAEQRLALHADSARSYLAALRMRPAEGRWMLGAAISLAADGQADEAQAWAERARERGAVTPAMETYLQQVGLAARR